MKPVLGGSLVRGFSMRNIQLYALVETPVCLTRPNA
jgi:hypothetical protein